MILSYPAKIKYISEDRAYLVEFPDLPGCLTEGKTLEEAKFNAREALTGYLASIFERNLKIPEPSEVKGKGVYPIEPEPKVAVPVALKKLREKKKLTQGDVARVLGISYQAYQRLEKPGKSNPTLKTLERLAMVFNKDLRLEFAERSAA
jgi:antitoxin HicB